ncbi:MAG: hypothetical protein MJZ25_03880 [Fibrobacter sp.]|nr:hypothetical protein [Fibrobacter sp.]
MKDEEIIKQLSTGDVLKYINYDLMTLLNIWADRAKQNYNNGGEVPEINSTMVMNWLEPLIDIDKYANTTGLSGDALNTQVDNNERELQKIYGNRNVASALAAYFNNVIDTGNLYWNKSGKENSGLSVNAANGSLRSLAKSIGMQIVTGKDRMNKNVSLANKGFNNQLGRQINLTLRDAIDSYVDNSDSGTVTDAITALINGYDFQKMTTCAKVYGSLKLPSSTELTDANAKFSLRIFGSSAFFNGIRRGGAIPGFFAVLQKFAKPVNVDGQIVDLSADAETLYAQFRQGTTWSEGRIGRRHRNVSEFNMAYPYSKAFVLQLTELDHVIDKVDAEGNPIKDEKGNTATEVVHNIFADQFVAVDLTDIDATNRIGDSSDDSDDGGRNNAEEGSVSQGHSDLVDMRVSDAERSDSVMVKRCMSAIKRSYRAYSKIMGWMRLVSDANNAVEHSMPMDALTFPEIDSTSEASVIFTSLTSYSTIIRDIIEVFLTTDQTPIAYDMIEGMYGRVPYMAISTPGTKENSKHDAAEHIYAHALIDDIRARIIRVVNGELYPSLFSQLEAAGYDTDQFMSAEKVVDALYSMASSIDSIYNNYVSVYDNNRNQIRTVNDVVSHRRGVSNSSDIVMNVKNLLSEMVIQLDPLAKTICSMVAQNLEMPESLVVDTFRLITNSNAGLDEAKRVMTMLQDNDFDMMPYYDYLVQNDESFALHLFDDVLFGRKDAVDHVSAVNAATKGEFFSSADKVNLIRDMWFNNFAAMVNRLVGDVDAIDAIFKKYCVMSDDDMKQKVSEYRSQNPKATPDELAAYQTQLAEPLSLLRQMRTSVDARYEVYQRIQSNNGVPYDDKAACFKNSVCLSLIRDFLAFFDEASGSNYGVIYRFAKLNLRDTYDSIIGNSKHVIVRGSTTMLNVISDTRNDFDAWAKTAIESLIDGISLDDIVLAVSEIEQDDVPKGIGIILDVVPELSKLGRIVTHVNKLVDYASQMSRAFGDFKRKSFSSLDRDLDEHTEQDTKSKTTERTSLKKVQSEEDRIEGSLYD